MESRLTISIDSRGAKSNAEALRKELDQLTDAGSRTSAQTNALSGRLTGLGKTLARGAGIVGGVELIRRSLTGLVASTREFETINARLAAFSSNVSGEQEFLARTADDLSTSYSVLASSYSGFLALQKNGLLTQTESRDLLVGFTSIAKVAAVSNVQLEQSYYGLNQAISSGQVTVEDYSQSVSSIPILSGELDRAAGLAAGGFKKLVKEGQVTSEFFKNTLITALSDYERQVKSSSETVDKSLARTANEFGRFKDNFTAPVSIVLRTVLNGTDTVLEAVNDRLDQAGKLTDTLTDRFNESDLSTAAFSANIDVLNAGLSGTEKRAREAGIGLTILQAALNPLDTIGNVFDKFDSSGAVASLRDFNSGLIQNSAEAEANIKRLRDLQVARIKALESGDGFLGIQSESSRNSDLEKTRERVEQLDRALASMGKNAVADARATSDEFEQLNNVIAGIVPNAQRGASLLDRLLPDRKKLREVAAARIELQQALSAGDIGQSGFDQANRALDQQLSRINGSAQATDELKRKTSEVATAVSALNDQYATQLELIQRRRTATEATITQNLQVNLPEGVTGGLTDGQAESLRVKAHQRMLDDIAALDEKAAQVSRRTAEIQARERAEQQQTRLTQEVALRESLAQARRSIDPIGQERAEYQQQLEGFREQLNFRLISQQDYQTQAVAASIEHAQRLEGLERAASDNALAIALASGANRETAESAHQKRLGEISNQSANVSKLREQYAQGELSQAQFHAALEAAQQAHEDRMSSITGSGFAESLNRLNDYTSAIGSFYQNRLDIAANAAQQTARNDQTAEQQALAAFEESGTEANRLAYEQARQRADISEKAARDRFEQEKKSGIALARLSQALAVAQALSSTGNFLVNLGLAATAALRVQQTIDSLKAQQFNGGSDFSSSGGSSAGASGGSTITASEQPAAQAAAAAPQQTVVIFSGNYTSEDEARYETGRQFKQLVESGYINSDLSSPEAFGNLPEKIVRVA